MSLEQYFSEKVLKQELKYVFTRNYLGHTNSIPENGDFRVSDHDEGVMIVNKDGVYNKLSNICAHRQAIMMMGIGKVENIVCPLHSWTYDLEGNLIGAPHFDDQPCERLPISTPSVLNGIIMDSKYLKGLDGLFEGPITKDINFDGYKFHSKQVHECNYNWKTFIEVYLEDYHVDVFHPGLRSVVDCSSLEWEFGEQYSAQRVGRSKIIKPGSAKYMTWIEELKDYRALSGTKPEENLGAIWLTIYPNIMVEVYEEAIMISTLVPISPTKTKNIVEFFYREDIAEFEPALVKAHQAAYMETCIEDDDIAERMDAGRKSLLDSGKPELDKVYYQAEMEAGMKHFHEYIDKRHRIIDARFIA